jgi:drug/metabolite transporter (DMT)-like permease
VSYYTIGLLLAGLSALAAATSHAFLKSGNDKLAIRAWSSLICAALALPVAISTGPLPPQFWPFMAGFASLSFINQIALVKSYQLSDFSQAYPVARGIAPLVMALLGVVILGDRVSAPAFAGITLITLGIISLALGKGMGRHGWAAALFTGLTTIGYNIILAMGIREASDAANFLAWLFLTDGFLIPLWLVTMTKGQAVVRLRQSWAIGWRGGLLTMLSFASMTYAMRFAPIGIVTAIRESSVLIALVLAALMLKEQLDKWRVFAGIFIVVGAAAIIFG